VIAPAVGDTLFAASGPTDHLHFIILGPARFESLPPLPHFLLVNMTSITPGIPYDPACELNVGDHRFVRQPSYIFYRRARFETVDHVERMLNTGAWRLDQRVTPELLARIQKGLQESKQAPRYFKHILPR
jgi:hypothetical protein